MNPMHWIIHAVVVLFIVPNALAFENQCAHPQIPKDAVTLLNSGSPYLESSVH